MTDYKAIFGKKIKFLTTDLTMSTATEGELFYSDTDSEFKVGVKVAAWAAGEAMSTAREGTMGFGIQTAAAAAGGAAAPGVTGATEEWDDTSWTTLSATLGNARQGYCSSGTTTAAVLASNNPTPLTQKTEEFSSAVTVRSMDTT